MIIEAGSTFGWLGMIPVDPRKTLLVGIDEFGASAPQKELAEAYGLTSASIIAKIKEKFLD